MLDKSSTSVSSIFDSGRSSTGTKTAATSIGISPNNSINDFNDNKNKSIILLVGLPATGKSTICKLLTNYLNSYTRFKTKIFNCGKVRRETLNNNKFHNYEFFDPSNQIFTFKRELIAMNSLSNLIDELNSNAINIGILDATNTTKERRSNLVKLITEKTKNGQLELDNLIILDIQCNDPKLIKFNIIAKTENEDYRNREFDQAIEDFTKRLYNYRKAYEEITDEELASYQELSSYINIENGCQTFDFKNFTKSDLINVLYSYFTGYSSYESKLYFKQVNDYYDTHPSLDTA